eukprot:CAMPEP_0119479144 /NCGR_PEP_ID=MMETSP1344-20130328/8554_1 /TAXON_ID=236787 /ORGANISM="Florenciella parvula, Strain CCMP2471" /LENGTH=254 /DNA_ID=CAMNT_0007513359 /DNA_START=63 /DNA_END=823 /DNA_ORIENTATION=-
MASCTPTAAREQYCLTAGDLKGLEKPYTQAQVEALAVAKYGSVENVAAEAARRAEDRASKKRKREADKASAGAERDQARVLHMSVLRSLLEARAFPPGVVAWLLETPEAVTWARRKTFNPEPTQMRAAAAVVVEQLIKFQAEAETRRTDLLQTIRQRLVAAERQSLNEAWISQQVMIQLPPNEPAGLCVRLQPRMIEPNGCFINGFVKNKQGGPGPLEATRKAVTGDVITNVNGIGGTWQNVMMALNMAHQRAG